MKRWIGALLAMALCLALLPPLPAGAEGEGNIDGGGGGMGTGTAENKWSAGNDGVRVTVIRAGDGAIMTAPVDLTNIDASGTEYSFGKMSKLSYKRGASLALHAGEYISRCPETPLPRIISSSSTTASIAAIKAYFCSEYVLKGIANYTGMAYDTLISGDYKLLLEPIAYFTFQGYTWAMTATEAALYNQLLGGGLRSKLVSLTSKNLPLAMFLDYPDLGFPAFYGSTTSKQSDDTIFKMLGVGIVKFNGAEAPVIGSADYEYRTDTDVVTSVTVYNNGPDMTPDHPGSVSFQIGGTVYTKEFLCPSGYSQLVWVKWHTPATPQVVTITVTGGGMLPQSIRADIVTLEEITPPDPQFVHDNPYPDFKPEKTPNYGSDTTASWTRWFADWVPPVIAEDEDGDSYEAQPGYWNFYTMEYTVRLQSDLDLDPDSRVKTAEVYNGNDWMMKSGYGVNATCDVVVRTGGYPSFEEDFTEVQNAVAVFPEFDFETYNRLLEPDDEHDRSTTWRLKKNEYSYYSNRVHFTPLWYPDYTWYTVAVAIFDVWTPCGMLYATESDQVYINGDVYDDWMIRIIE